MQQHRNTGCLYVARYVRPRSAYLHADDRYYEAASIGDYLSRQIDLLLDLVVHFSLSVCVA